PPSSSERLFLLVGSLLFELVPVYPKKQIALLLVFAKVLFRALRRRQPQRVHLAFDQWLRIPGTAVGVEPHQDPLGVETAFERLDFGFLLDRSDDGVFRRLLLGGWRLVGDVLLRRTTAEE